jgi:hypothetical protein
LSSSEEYGGMVGLTSDMSKAGGQRSTRLRHGD